MESINSDNNGFFNLVPVLNDNMFSIAARKLYDTKVRKLKKLDKTFMELGKQAISHIKRMTDGINEYGTLALADYKLITSLNKEAVELGDSTRRNIDAALKEVIEAIDGCEDECQEVEQQLYMVAQEYLSGANRVYSAKIATVMFEITNQYDTILSKHDNKMLEKREGAAQQTAAPTPTITPSSSIQHIASTFSAKELAWDTNLGQ